MLSPALRRFVLFVHVLVSLGFPGAVAGFFALAVIALATPDAGTALAIYRCLELMTLYAIVPLSLLALATGLVSSLGTPWGLVRHWWVLVKLLLTLPSTAILLLHLMPIGALARAKALGAATRETQLQLALASSLALAVLILLTALSIYKPRGLTAFGARALVR